MLGAFLLVWFLVRPTSVLRAQAVGMCTIAGVVSRFYWSKTKSAKEMGRLPLVSALLASCWYHVGSLCFGALILAVLQFVRVPGALPAIGTLCLPCTGPQYGTVCGALVALSLNPWFAAVNGAVGGGTLPLASLHIPRPRSNTLDPVPLAGPVWL